MMLTNEIWASAKKEFKELAYKRFMIKDGFFGREPENYVFDDNDHLELYPDFERAEFKPFNELLDLDMEFYGCIHNALLMWNFRTNSSEGLILISRKTSAALPFDLERAKAGDVVTFLESTVKCRAFKEGKVLTQFDWLNEEQLRMEYPPRIKQPESDNDRT